ncbi:MAG: B12-binding domain-containing radical SAM protein [archaeon]|nr:B12-binding domain-containing radical SAM protein [archaeon]
MKILLIYPEYPNTYWSFKGVLKYVEKKASFPPLGLLTVASLLPKKWEKKRIDLNVNELSDKNILWADMIFISAMIVQKDDAVKIIRKCKQLDKMVVVGGPLFSTGYEDLSDMGIDHFVLDEGEITLPLFLEDLMEGIPQKIYKSDLRPDITKTPLPMWDLIDFNDYSSLAIQYSRGCPFNCEFCDIIVMNGRKPRTKTPEQMLNEFQAIYETGYRGGIFIVDDNFIGNKKNVKKMLRATKIWLKEREYPFSFLTEASLNIVQDEELLKLMMEANFFKVFLGIETPSLESLKECGKLQNTKLDMVEAVKKLHRCGIQVMAGFIVGFDNDREDIFDAQIEFIQKTGITIAMIGMLMALPKTALWKRLKKEDRLLKRASGENTDGELNFIPKMGTTKLLNGYKRILATIYSPQMYYKRVFQFIKDFDTKAQGIVNKEILLTALKAFIRSIVEIGIKSKSRGLYWKLLIKTLLLKPILFPTAIESAIYGLHFETITKNVLKKRIGGEIISNNEGNLNFKEIDSIEIKIPRKSITNTIRK